MPGPITYSTFSSISSLPSNPRSQASQIAKAYRQAAQLFLTRRLPEAYFTIEPVITPRNHSSAGQRNQHQNQHSIGDDDNSNGLQANDGPGGAENNSSEFEYEPAPVAYASRGTRVKVWSFYLTFLNAVVELGPEEGKLAFGSARWKELVSKARDGSIWENVVRDGYWGDEGAVDGEVIVNLATLLLTHSPSQTLNQQCLETFLATSPLFFQSSNDFDGIDNSTNNEVECPDLNTTSYSRPPQSSISEEEATTDNKNNNRIATRHNLDLALKILELYSLHILPRNDEWEYAREFIQMNSMLDEERRQAFLIALHVLREEERLAAVRGEEQWQMNGRTRRKKARTGGKREMEMGRRRSDATITATGSSIPGDEAATLLAEKEHKVTVPAAASREAEFASWSAGSGLGFNSNAEMKPEESGHQRQKSSCTSKESQSSFTPTPTYASDSKAKTVPTQQQQPPTFPASAPAPVPASRTSENPPLHTKQVNPPVLLETNTKHNKNNTKLTKNKTTNTFTKILSSLFSPSPDGKSTSGSNILSSLFSIRNKRLPGLVRSILYILAILTGLGLIGSAAAAGTTSATRTRTRTGISGGGGEGGSRRVAGAVAPLAGKSKGSVLGMRLGLDVRKFLRMLGDLVVLVWMSVKRTVGMGVAISYV